VTAQMDTSETGFTAPTPMYATRTVDVGAAFGAYHDRLYAAVLRSTRDDEVAHDIVQDAFLELVRANRAGRVPENELAWLHRVAANRVIDWSRRRARWAGHVPAEEGLGEGPEATVIRRESRRELHAVLDRLPADARRALVLEGEGYQPAEIAPLIGRTNQATRTFMCRARRRMRDDLTPQAA